MLYRGQRKITKNKEVLRRMC